MLAYNRTLLLLIAIHLLQQLPCTADKYRVYTKSNGQLCFWQGDTPFCFIGSGCPTHTTVLNSSKSCDGAYCWIGNKCIALQNEI